MVLLQAHLTEVLGNKVQKVYTKPPAALQMVYPCVLINRASGSTAFADNQVHRHQKRFQLTGITEDTNEILYDALALLPRCVHDRSFTADNLNHHVFTIFF